MDSQTNALNTGANAKARAHEVARLRARRAARRSVEAAAGQRRMAAAGVCVALILVVAIVVYLSDAVTWPTVLVPVFALVGIIAWSRRSALIAEQADQRDRERLAQLRSTYRRHEAIDQRVEPVVSTLAPSIPEPDEVSEVDEVDEPDVFESVAEGEESVPEVKVWTPSTLPPSRYSQGARVKGRVVHADTDLRGIPRVAAQVPARPVAPTEDVQTRSTEDVASSIPLAFDLDEILEARRA